jgi:hypothetical protein
MPRLPKRVQMVGDAFPEEERALASAHAGGGELRPQVVVQEVEWHGDDVRTHGQAGFLQAALLVGEEPWTIHFEDGRSCEHSEARRAAVETCAQDSCRAPAVTASLSRKPWRVFSAIIERARTNRPP